MAGVSTLLRVTEFGKFTALTVSIEDKRVLGHANDVCLFCHFGVT